MKEKKDDYKKIDYRGKNVLIFGDLMLDYYIWGNVERISPEAPVPIVEVVDKSYNLGGCGNVANNISSLGGNAFLCSIIGDDKSSRKILEICERNNINTDGVLRTKERKTTTKVRIMSNRQQLLRIDEEIKTIVSDSQIKNFKDIIEKINVEIHVILISDYLKGVVESSIINYLSNKFKDSYILVDPKGTDYKKYGKVYAITPNLKEAKEFSKKEKLSEMGKYILNEADVQNVIITRGKNGMSLYGKTYEKQFPAKRPRQVFDVCGAGDTVLATLGLEISKQSEIFQAIKIANIAGGIVVGKIGTSFVTPLEIERVLNENK